MTPNELPILSSPEIEVEYEQAEQIEAEENCGNCRFFRPSDGRCQQRPPTGKQWSIVTPEDWCGKWEAGEQRDATVETEELAEVME